MNAQSKRGKTREGSTPVRRARPKHEAVSLALLQENSLLAGLRGIVSRTLSDQSKAKRHTCTNQWLDGSKPRTCNFQLYRPEDGDLEDELAALKKQRESFLALSCKERGETVAATLQQTQVPGGQAVPLAPFASISYQIGESRTSPPSTRLRVPPTHSLHASAPSRTAHQDSHPRFVLLYAGERKVCRSVFQSHYPVSSSTLARQEARKRWAALNIKVA